MDVICVHMCVQVCLAVYTQRPEKTLDQNSIPLREHLLLNLILAWELASPSDSSVSGPYRARVIGWGTAYLLFYTGAGGLDWGLHACTENILTHGARWRQKNPSPGFMSWMKEAVTNTDPLMSLGSGWRWWGSDWQPIPFVLFLTMLRIKPRPLNVAREAPTKPLVLETNSSWWPVVCLRGTCELLFLAQCNLVHSRDRRWKHVGMLCLHLVHKNIVVTIAKGVLQKQTALRT